jgi:hypothetical protein
LVFSIQARITHSLPRIEDVSKLTVEVFAEDQDQQPAQTWERAFLKTPSNYGLGPTLGGQRLAPRANGPNPPITRDGGGGGGTLDLHLLLALVVVLFVCPLYRPAQRTRSRHRG